MATKLSFRYDREGDILYIDRCVPYEGQQSDEIADGIIARFHPATREIENLEILFFSKQVLAGELFELPVFAELRIAV